MSRPTGTIAKKGIELLTMATPNGHKASILLEELKDAYPGFDYTYQKIDIMTNVQKEPWFTKYCPNGRIPTIIDHDNDDFGVMEGSAILTYLTRKHDSKGIFTFTEDPDLSLGEQWIAWLQSGLGPMQGQANHFFRLAKERIPYPTQRYVGESERLYGILDKRLEGRDYVVGDRYSIVDIAIFAWVNIAYFSGLELTKFTNVQSWWERIIARPAVKRGLTIPSESMIVNIPYLEKLKTDDEFKKEHDELHQLLADAQKQYNYKYTSP